MKTRPRIIMHLLFAVLAASSVYTGVAYYTARTSWQASTAHLQTVRQALRLAQQQHRHWPQQHADYLRLRQAGYLAAEDRLTLLEQFEAPAWPVGISQLTLQASAQHNYPLPTLPFTMQQSRIDLRLTTDTIAHSLPLLMRVHRLPGDMHVQQCHWQRSNTTQTPWTLACEWQWITYGLTSP